jgi:hypothetical protein
MKKTKTFVGAAMAFTMSLSALSAPAAVFAGASADEPPLCSAYPLTKDDNNEILWLARVMYSETKDADEMRLIAWVVRNRVETDYHGSTYAEVAQSKDQFSGLNPGDPQYKTNISLDYSDTKNAVWQTALRIAREVYYAPDSERPFSQSVRHFYSPDAVSTEPSWAKDASLALASGDEFVFYDNVQ